MLFSSGSILSLSCSSESSRLCRLQMKLSKTCLKFFCDGRTCFWRRFHLVASSLFCCSRCCTCIQKAKPPSLDTRFGASKRDQMKVGGTRGLLFRVNAPGAHYGSKGTRGQKGSIATFITQESKSKRGVLLSQSPRKPHRLCGYGVFKHLCRPTGW